MGENRAMHLWDDVVMECGGHILEEWCTVDVQSRCIERPVGGPLIGIGFGGNDVKSLDGVVEIRKINFGISRGHWLVLGLGEENLVFVVDEELTFISIEIHIGTKYLHVAGGERTSTALHANFDVMVLETHEREGLGPVITEKEWKNVVVRVCGRTESILGNFIKGYGARRLSLVILVQEIVNTLNVQGVDLRNLLTTDPELELSGGRFILIEKTEVGTTGSTDVFRLDPNITQKITLRLDGYSDLITATEGTDVIKTFRLDGEISVPLVVLTEKSYLGLTSDVHILSTHRNEVN
jgi:hypothetical protein